tara:strand:- start:24 stop:488 length:465 start_codon:yes stop_codon:yes gene_type:complete
LIVLDIEEIINSNKQYEEILIKINNNQDKSSNLLKKDELELENLFEEIEDSKLLLDENEINRLIEEYNIKSNKFNEVVESFNLHYQEQIVEIRKFIIQEIIVLAEKYAKDNNIDIILDSSSYLIASNKINITGIIREKLNNIDLKLEFKDFEKN